MENIILGVIVYIFTSYCISKIAIKLGEEECAVLAWIPIFNFYILVKLADFSGITVLIFLIPVVNYIFLGFCLMKICALLDRDPILGLLMFIPIVDLILLGYVAFTDVEKPRDLINDIWLNSGEFNELAVMQRTVKR